MTFEVETITDFPVAVDKNILSCTIFLLSVSVTISFVICRLLLAAVPHGGVYVAMVMEQERSEPFTPSIPRLPPLSSLLQARASARAAALRRPRPLDPPGYQIWAGDVSGRGHFANVHNFSSQESVNVFYDQSSNIKQKIVLINLFQMKYKESVLK